ncbi:hypothetical protein BPNPMPFG_000738 [Mesorhizobium sp. AR07]|uniref:hypothetical protein n=1 Tax=Mesorhizobium sp. AR07 TaxID=2865838 RepID=UPI00215F1EB0|nr:hypothetical protein [Mesorhizobium sp. AR07]UVK47614.1 hypothetical protein BPNPMPFG_000738 [Mesorhizobium sp. AR07]
MNDSLGFWTKTYACTVLLGVAFAAVYISLELPVYYWDFDAYFTVFNEQGAFLVESPSQWLPQLKASVERDDYSSAILAPLMPFYIFFGGSRLSYVAAIVTVYLVPAALFMGRMSYLEAVSETSPSRSWFAVWIAAFLYTPFWAATLRGLPDVGGCLALSAATYFLWKSRFLTHQPVISGIRVGAYLWLAFMLRRWYAFAVMGIAISSALFCLFQVAKDRDFPALWKAALGGVCAILVIVAAAWIFQLPLIVKILATSYGDLYSGYKTDFVSQLDQVGSRINYVNWLLIILGLWISIVRRNSFSLFCAVASALTFLLFTRMQDLDRHHSMPIFLWLFPAYAQAIVAIVSMPALRPRWATIVIAVAAGFAYLGTFFPIGRQLLAPISYVFAREATLPLHLDNLPEYTRLIDDLLGKMRPEDRFSVFASGAVMNDWLLFGMNSDLDPYIEWASQVDSRNQFGPRTLKSKYVVVTDPPVTHLRPDAQICITIPNQDILEGKGIGAAYKRIAAYRLSGDVKGYLYEQVRPVSRVEIDALYGEFRKKYPGWATPEW